MSRSMTRWLGTAGLLLAGPFLLLGCYKPPSDSAQLAQDREAPLTERPRTFTNSIGMKMVLIPAGEFLMGSERYAKERPVHTVKIAKPFCMGMTEVTRAQWKAVMGASPTPLRGDDSRPAELVAWDDAQTFCEKLSVKEGITYRLPTEAEWEYACRAGTTGKYCFGDDEGRLGEYAWFRGNTAPRRILGIAVGQSDFRVRPVAQKKPNAWGLYDMHGNVYEWCEDVWHHDYDGAPTDGSAWLTDGDPEYATLPDGSPLLTDGDKKLRVLRGGAFGWSSRQARCAYRFRGFLRIRTLGIGFRVVSSLPVDSESPGSEQAKE